MAHTISGHAFNQRTVHNEGVLVELREVNTITGVISPAVASTYTNAYGFYSFAGCDDAKTYDVLIKSAPPVWVEIRAGSGGAASVPDPLTITTVVATNISVVNATINVATIGTIYVTAYASLATTDVSGPLNVYNTGFIEGDLRIDGDNGIDINSRAENNTGLDLNAYGDTEQGPALALAHLRGSVATATKTLDGDKLGEITFWGYTDDGWWGQGARIKANQVGEVGSNGVLVSQLALANYAADDGNLVDRIILTSTGAVYIPGALIIDGDITAPAVIPDPLVVNNLVVSSSAEINAADSLILVSNPGNGIDMTAYGDTNDGPYVFMSKSRGTVSTKSAVQNNDVLGGIQFNGWEGGWRAAGLVCAYVDGVPSTTSMPTRIEVKTTPAGSITPATRVVIDSTGTATFSGLVVATNSIAVSGNMAINGGTGASGNVLTIVGTQPAWAAAATAAASPHNFFSTTHTDVYTGAAVANGVLITYDVLNGYWKTLTLGNPGDVLTVHALGNYFSWAPPTGGTSSGTVDANLAVMNLLGWA